MNVSRQLNKKEARVQVSPFSFQVGVAIILAPILNHVKQFSKKNWSPHEAICVCPADLCSNVDYIMYPEPIRPQLQRSFFEVR
jgi:hypothetical protein